MNSDFDFKSPGDIRAQNAPKKAGSPLAPLRRRLFFLRAGSFTVSAAPLTVLLILRFPRYAATPGQTVRLGAGCLVLCLFLLLKVFGKLKVPGRVTVFATVFLLSICSRRSSRISPCFRARHCWGRRWISAFSPRPWPRPGRNFRRRGRRWPP